MHIRIIFFVAIFYFTVNNCVGQKQDSVLYITGIPEGKTTTATKVKSLKALRHHDSTVEIVYFQISANGPGYDGIFFASNTGLIFGKDVLKIISMATPGSIIAFQSIAIKTGRKETSLAPVIFRIIK